METDFGSLTNVRLEKESVDPLSPPPPVAPYRDASAGAWVLSRYADVLAAFREPRLQLGRGRSEDSREISDPSLQLRVRAETSAALSAANLAYWRVQVEHLACALMDQLPNSRRVDIVQEFARPLSLASAVIVTGADPTDSKRLGALAAEVSLATADPSNSALQHNVPAANMELERSLQNSPIPMGGPAFVALSQTLACFLANAWLTLLRNPSELARLRNQPDLMPRAIEELLRYAGVAHKVSRHAIAPVTLGDISIAQGERVILMVASANRDPEQFPLPDRLDLTRRMAGHVAFGVGLHSCVGAFLIRTMAAVATRVFIERFAEGQDTTRIEWHGGSGFRWVASLYVLLGDGHTG